MPTRSYRLGRRVSGVMRPRSASSQTSTSYPSGVSAATVVMSAGATRDFKIARMWAPVLISRPAVTRRMLGTEGSGARRDAGGHVLAGHSFHYTPPAWSRSHCLCCDTIGLVREIGAGETGGLLLALLLILPACGPGGTERHGESPARRPPTLRLRLRPSRWMIRRAPAPPRADWLECRSGRFRRKSPG